MKVFDQLVAHARLTKLASSPYDLSESRALTGERVDSYQVECADFTMLYSTQCLDDKVFAALQQLADESGVIEQFKAMAAGAVINRIDGVDSENRQVLHTACRDIFSKTPMAPAATSQSREQLAGLKGFLNDLEHGRLLNDRGETFTDMIHIGIGGSDLGPRALALALRPFFLKGRRVHFIANIDPDEAALVMAGLDLSRTLVNLVSKSGTTMETRANEELVRQSYLAAGLEPSRYFMAVTGENSRMDNPDNYLRIFHMFDYIGGRYSVTSMVGGVVLGFALGYEGFKQILAGANKVDLACGQVDISRNLPLLLALIGVWNRNFLGYETLAIVPYSQALASFPAHLQQCDMESNGKSIDRHGKFLSHESGPILWGEVGTNGQHAFFQLLHQGTTVVPVEFIGFRHSQQGHDLDVGGATGQQKLMANMLAQSLALATGRIDDNPNQSFAGNRPSSILLADRLTPETMGQLLAIYEAKIIFQGFIWNINSFDQEGVQLGKDLAGEILSKLTDSTVVEQEESAIMNSLLKACGMI